MVIKVKISRKKQQHDALSQACQDDDIDKVKALVESGLDLTEPWTSEYYPISRAMYCKTTEILSYLMKHGMPIHINCARTLKREGKKAIKDMLLVGCWDKMHHEASMFLLKSVDQVNTSNTSYSGLVTITQLTEFELGNVETSKKADEYLQMLLDKGADVDFPTQDGETLLHAICCGDNSKYSELLIRRSKNIDAAPKKEPYNSPLSVAVRCGNDTAVKTLLELGAAPNRMMRRRKKTILDDAVYWKGQPTGKEEKHAQIIKLLIAHGAKTYQQMVDDGDIKND